MKKFRRYKHAVLTSGLLKQLGLMLLNLVIDAQAVTESDVVAIETPRSSPLLPLSETVKV